MTAGARCPRFRPSVSGQMASRLGKAASSAATSGLMQDQPSPSGRMRPEIQRGSARGSSIAEMVIQLGRNLGLAVIAEGVEDERQAQILQSLGCPLAQGFLFARPMTADALNGWLNNDALEGVA
eukprot:gene1083-biopygen916